MGRRSRTKASEWRSHIRTDVRPWQLFALPRWLVVFVIIVVVADAAGIAAAARSTMLRPADVLLFGLLVACGAVTVEMTRRLGETALLIKDVCGVWELPVAILLPPVYALLVPIPRIALTQWRVRSIAPHRRVFTAAAVSLSYGAAYTAFHGFSRLDQLSLTGSGRAAAAWILAVAACFVVQWAVNIALVLIAVKGSDATANVRELVLSRESLYNDLTELCVALLVTLGIAVSPVSLVFALPFVTLLQRSGRHSQLVSDSRIDSKTGLLNAVTWRRESSAEVARAARTGSALALMLLDIDRFKALNDSRGHLAGDKVLAAVGQTLRLLVRDYDLTGRFGGDEFAVLLPQTDQASARQIAERIRSEIAALRVDAPPRPQSHEAGPIRLTVSVGIATSSGGRSELTHLLAAADAAMYRAKGTGRNQVWMTTESASFSLPDQADEADSAVEPGRASQGPDVAPSPSRGSASRSSRQRASQPSGSAESGNVSSDVSRKSEGEAQPCQSGNTDS